MESEVLQRKEKVLLAHLLAGMADILEAPGAKELVASLTKKIAEVICERAIKIETSLTLLSLLEDLSAWSVSLLQTNVLKGTLELKAVEMKIGTIPDFIDPYKVTDELLLHSNVVKGLSHVILPPSPPPDGPVVCPNLNILDNVGAETPSALESPSTMSFTDSFRTLSSMSSGSSTFENVLTPCLSTSLGEDVPDADTLDPNHDKENSDTVDIAQHKLPLITERIQAKINDVAFSTGAEVLITLNDSSGVVRVEGSSKNRKSALMEIKKILDSLSVQEGLRYALPSWMAGEHLTGLIQQIALDEGCTVDQLTDSQNNRSYVFIQSERGWNIRRCVERLQEFENQYCAADRTGKCDSNRIEYDRTQLLMVRDTLSSCDMDTPFLKELTAKAQYFDLLAEDHSH